MTNKDKEIEKFMEAIEKSFEGMNLRTNWPLNGAQIDSYFDVDEGLDMYYRIQKLRKTKTVKEIADMMPAPDIIRIFLQHNAIVGLKVANKLGIAKISPEERTDYVLFLFKILEEKIEEDIFCLKGKNLILNNQQSTEILDSINWNLIDNIEDKRKLAFLTVLANNLCYTLYFDTYMIGGFYIHGPYDANKKFGENTILLVREFHNLNPKELWQDLNIPYKNLRIFAVYKDLDLKINFVNHPVTRDSIGDKLIAFKIYLDNKEIKLDKVDELIELFQKVSSAQTKKVNSWNDLDKVRKGAEITHYLFKDFREKTSGDWRPSKEIERTIEKFGDEFIKKFSFENKTPDLEHWKKIFDPRDNYY